MPPNAKSMNLMPTQPRMNDSADPALLDSAISAELRNIDPFYAGEFRKRNGYQRLWATAIKPSDATVAQVTSLIPYDVMYGGTRYSGILCSDGQYFWTITGSSGTQVQSAALVWQTAGTAYSTGTAGTIWRGQNYEDGVLLTNGVDKPLWIYYGASGFKIVLAGISAPAATGFSAASRANGGTGWYVETDIVYIRFSLVNSVTGRESNLSAAASAADDIGTLKVTVGAGHNDIRVTIPGKTTLSQDGVDKVNVYVTRASDTASNETELWYHGQATIASGATTTDYDLTITDATEDVLYESAYTDTETARIERDIPPNAKRLCGYNNRMFYAGAGAANSPYAAQPANWILWSGADKPDYVAFKDQEIEWYDGTKLPTRGDILGLIRAGDRMIALSKDESFTIVGEGDQFGIIQGMADDGCIAGDSTVSAGNQAYYIGRSGAYRHNGAMNGQQSLTRKVLDRTYATLNSTNLPSSIGLYYGTKRQVWFFVPTTSTAIMDTVLVCQLDESETDPLAWVIYDGIHAKAACVARTVFANTTTEYVFWVDDNNVLYVGDQGTCDGAATPSAALNATLNGTVTAGASTTLTDSTRTGTPEAFYTTSLGLKGCPVWVCDANGNNMQMRWISSNTGTQLTVSAAWTSTPQAGWLYSVGGIHFKMASAAAMAVAEGFRDIIVDAFHAHLARDSYSGTDAAWYYLLLDGATSINGTDKKYPLKLGASDWAGGAFENEVAHSAGQAQVVVEDIHADRAIRIRKATLSYRATGALAGSYTG